MYEYFCDYLSDIISPFELKYIRTQFSKRLYLCERRVSSAEVQLCFLGSSVEVKSNKMRIFTSKLFTG